MAWTIDSRLGRDALVQTVRMGPTLPLPIPLRWRLLNIATCLARAAERSSPRKPQVRGTRRVKGKQGWCRQAAVACPASVCVARGSPRRPHPSRLGQ